MTFLQDCRAMVEELQGGVANAGSVVRDGDVVLRPAPANVRTLHRLLEHLASREFPSPVPLGVREDGREALRFIAGETSMPPYPHQWVRSGDTLTQVGRLLRALHDATRGFAARSDSCWSRDLADPRGGAVICHNDICIENVVFSNGTVVGLLDFDFAAPGRPEWDLAMTARYWVPLQDPISAAASGRGSLDVFGRVRQLADAYGADDEIRQTFTAVLIEIEEVALQFVMERVDREVKAFVKMWNELGGNERQRRKMDWLRKSQLRIDDALTA